MYKEYFGLREKPFNPTPDPRFYYINPTISSVSKAIHNAVQERQGFVVLTGEVGTGKTTLLRKLMAELNATVNFAFYYTTTLTFDALLSFVCQDLGLMVDGCDRLKKIDTLKEFLTAQLAQGRTTVILVDEAQNLGERTLDNLQTLLDLKSGDEKLLQIVLVGQPELQTKLDQPRLEGLKRQIAVHCQLHCLKTSEVGPFIRYRLGTAGFEGRDLFTEEAILRIAGYSKGIPRLINIVSDNSLLMAFAQSRKRVSAAMIDEIARDLRLKEDSPVICLETAESGIARDARQIRTPERAIVAINEGAARRLTVDANARKGKEYRTRLVGLMEEQARRWRIAGATQRVHFAAGLKHMVGKGKEAGRQLAANVVRYSHHRKLGHTLAYVSAAGEMRHLWMKNDGTTGWLYRRIGRSVRQAATTVRGGLAPYGHRPHTWLEAATVLLVFALLLGGTRGLYSSEAALQFLPFWSPVSTTTDESQRANVVTAPELGFAVLGKGAQDSNRSLAALVRDGEAYFSYLQAIYEQELASDPSLMGSIVLDLTIQPDGKPSHVDFLSNKLKNKRLRTALSEIVRNWQFSSASGPVRVRYPVLFIPPGIDAASIIAWEKNTSEVKTELAATKPGRYLAEITEPGKYKVVLLTYVRSRPRDDAEIITSLRPPVKVWVERVMGKYLEVLALPGQRIRGYIHQQDAFLTPTE